MPSPPRSTRRPLLRWAALACLLSLSVGGCAETDTEVRVAGAWQQQECALGDFLWEPPFATWVPGPDGSGILRVQDSAGPLTRNDHLVIAFRSAQALRERLGQPISIGAEADGALGFGTLNFHARCPRSERSSTTLHGTVTFQEFSGQLDSRVRGIATLTARDARDPGKVAGEDLTFEFSFRVLRFPPYQPFNSNR